LSDANKRYLLFEVGVISLSGVWLAFEVFRQMRIADAKSAKLK
jgi:hypothetical protein